VRAVVTGAAGFAGGYLVDACTAAGDEVVALARATCDLRDANATRAAIAAARPEVVYHLAARAHVGESWHDPAGTLHDNVAMTLNVLEAVRTEAPGALVVAIASGEIYDAPEQLPIAESAPLRPQNPYAVSKAAADLLACFYADAHGLRVVRVRAFNHAGPGQEPTYAISSFARQAAAGADRIVTGNPATRRDYTDVRDVVRAYRLLAERGEGGVFNVCSGRATATAELVAMLGRECDGAEPRPNEVMELRGSYERLRMATGWEPEIPLEQTVQDTLTWWRDGPGRARTAVPQPARDRPPRS
jgi:GDP-4-dehydro-6-deoxy-D-mannose reductase